MKSALVHLIGGLMLSSALMAALPDEPIIAVEALDPLVLTGTWESAAWGFQSVQIGEQRHRALDGAALISRAPGAAVMRNGAQTGIAQLRGLSGDRVRISLGGMTVSPACPNHMDPPLHYAGVSSLTQLELIAGASPVSFGGDSLGGVIRLIQPDPVFAIGTSPVQQGEISGFYRGSHDSYGSRGEYRLATEDVAVSYWGSMAHADDLRVRAGRVRASGFETQRHDLAASLKIPQGFVTLDAGLSRTRDAGTPALAMDMIEDDSWHVGLRHKAAFRSANLDSYVYVHDIAHLMTNHSLRAAAMRMNAPAASRDYGLRSELSRALNPAESSWVRVGIDLHRNEFEADQVMLATGAVRNSFADSRRERYGGFIEWESQWDAEWSTIVGLRGDWVKTHAGRVSHGFGPPAVAADAAAFNAGQRTHDDFQVDLMAAVEYAPNDQSSFEVALAVKNRAPSLAERYLWTPLSTSAGLADGRTYLGNPALDPETSMQLSASASRHGDQWEVKLTPFYQFIRDYIQGMPSARNDAAGKPVLRYENVARAELYGAELAARYAFTQQLSLSGHASYVRGRDTSNDDNLYRIAPLNGFVDLGWDNQRWAFHCELEWAAKQSRTAGYNDELATAGHALVHMRVAHQTDHGVRYELGIENLLDARCADHLGGINRVPGSDVAVGSRIPGAARFAYANISWRF